MHHSCIDDGGGGGGGGGGGCGDGGGGCCTPSRRHEIATVRGFYFKSNLSPAKVTHTGLGTWTASGGCISVESNRTKSTFDFFGTVLLHGVRQAVIAGLPSPSLTPSSMVETDIAECSVAGNSPPVPIVLMCAFRAARDDSRDERWRVSRAVGDDRETAEGEDGNAPATGGSGDEGIDRMRSETFFPLLPLKCFGRPSGSPVQQGPISKG
uniref:Uncharacterized protein n=1 Tax=Anopheles farauti TaxID=69004 RepID=A0A182QGW1_9DIPT